MKRLGSITFGRDVAALAAVGVILSFRLPLLAKAPSPWALAILSVATLLASWQLRLYTPDLIFRPVSAIAPILVATALGGLVAVVLPLPKPGGLTLGQFPQAWALAAGALCLSRLAMARRGARQVFDVRLTLIVGAGRVERMIERRLRREPGLGLQPVGFLDDDPPSAGDGDAAAPVLGGMRDLEHVIRAHKIRHVVIAFPKASEDELLEAARRCEMLGVTVAVVPRLFELAMQERNVLHLGCIPLVGVRRSTPAPAQVSAKHLVDRVASAILLVAFSPIIALTSAAVFVSLGRPIFFRQLRFGKDGRTFEILKLRTMTDGEPRGGDGGEEASRCTRVGAFLRATSLDELPQLFNILKGDMSFIGPRPERPELVADFRHRIYRYDDRHRVKGGISGWAQVHGIGRGADRFADAVLVDRAEWDNYYIEHWTPWLELRILIKTFAAVWRFRQRSSGSAAIDAPDATSRAGDGSSWVGDLTPVPAQFAADASAGLVDRSGAPSA